MFRIGMRTVAAGVAVAALGATAVIATQATAAPSGFTAGSSAQSGIARALTAHIPRTSRNCAVQRVGVASCNALRRDDESSTAIEPLAKSAAVSGLKPADLQGAYKLPSSTAGNGKTIAIVDAYDDPKAESDLGVYRSQFGLSSCTTANGCFKKVNGTGGSTPPKGNAGWDGEISLDLDMASAICPDCKILLVEASSASTSALGTAENTAAKLGATVISNSWGGGESSSDASQDTKYFDHPGVPMTFSTGDSGYGVEYPASGKYVTAVGGTSLKKASNTRGWTETAWSGAGSGCSAFTTKITGQANVSTGCSKRAVADVSAVADPNTGVAVYDSVPYQGFQGWQVYGGTSAAAPIVAGVYALAGNGVDNNYVYSHATSLFDVTSGSNGSCPTSQWCNARKGWDGPTGLGTPDGVAGF